MSEIVLRIDGPPRGKGRPRFSRASGRTYTDHRTQSAEQRVRLAWLEAGSPRLDGPIELVVNVALRRPGSHYKRDGTLSAAGKRSDWPTKTPDFDNVAKLIADALNRCAYGDDASVVHHRFIKRWASAGEREHTVVHIRPVAAALELAA